MKSCLIKKYILALLFISSTVAFAETATIISTTGKVEVNRNEAWVPVNKDTVIREGEIISTGFKSEALIKYSASEFGFDIVEHVVTPDSFLEHEITPRKSVL